MTALSVLLSATPSPLPKRSTIISAKSEALIYFNLNDCSGYEAETSLVSLATDCSLVCKKSSRPSTGIINTTKNNKTPLNSFFNILFTPFILLIRTYKVYFGDYFCVFLVYVRAGNKQNRF